jgi:ribosomal protein L13E
LSERPKKPKAKAAKKKAAQPDDKKAKTVWLRPRAEIPFATVTSRNGPDTVERRGRGFSQGELMGASVSRSLALKWGVPTDTRRRTNLDSNVQLLKKWFSGAKKTEKAAAPEAKKQAPKKKAAQKSDAE